MNLAKALRRLRDDRSGSAAILVAGFGAAMIMSLALSADVGNLYFQRRGMQSAIDIAALAAARDLPNAEAAARASLAENGYPAPPAFTVRRGAYVPNPKKSVDARFVAGATPSNAVELAMTTQAKLFFGRLLSSNTVSINVAARAVRTRLASFDVGSRLVSLDGGLANAALSGLLGASVSLSVMDYNALAAAEIDMPDLLNAVAGRVGGNVATYDEALALRPTGSQFASALADVVNGATARSALARIAGAGSSAPIRLDELLSFGPFGEMRLSDDIGLSATASALDVLFAGAGVARGGSQFDVGLGARLPGLAGATASVVVGERRPSSPWLAIGPEGATVRTAQMRVRITAGVEGPPGLPGLKVSVAADVAAAEARLAVLSCGANPATDAKVALDVTPSVADLWLGEPRNAAVWNDVARPDDVGPATLLDTALLKATAYAHVAARNLSPKRLTFDADDIARRRTRTVSTTDIAQSTLASATASPDVAVELKPLGAVLGTPTAVKSAIAGTVAPLGAMIDPVLNALLHLLGVGVGEAGVTVRGVRCDGSALIG